MKLKLYSPSISWETAAAVVAIPGTQQAWNPGDPSIPFDVPAIMEQSAQLMPVRARLVEETTEITRYPAVELILMDGLLSYEVHEGLVNRGHYLMLPQFPIVKQAKPGPDYSDDFCIGIVEYCLYTYIVFITILHCCLQGGRREILVEVKTSVALTMATIDGQQLAQVFIQAFYTLESYCLETIVVALTDKVTWHFFEV